MSDNSAFKSENIAAATITKHGLLEELHLPPQAIAFIRQNQRALIVGIVAVVVGILGWSWFSQYAASREDKAAMMLAKAMEISDMGQRKAQLGEIGKQFSGTDAALLGVIQQAHAAYEAGDLAGAIKGYEAALQDMAAKNPLLPLVQVDLAQAYADQRSYDQAVALYGKLTETVGFKGLAYLGLGRVHAQAGDAAKAREAFDKVIALENVSPPLREAAQAQLALL